MQCQLETGFVPDRLQLVPITALDETRWISELMPDRVFRKCGNYRVHAVCNWLVDDKDKQDLCVSCRLNKIIPDLSNPANYRRWYSLERAKRRTYYNLARLGLILTDRKADPVNGIEFRFMEDIREYDPYSLELVKYKQIMTGHDTGTITVNIEEADHSHREAVRETMNEPYRTTLGHIRHETGHYFWERLIAGSTHIDAFRKLFGDEREDYQQSLQNYYQSGPQADWQQQFISAYASAHAWEDWAETWAHYLHITDTMETACDYGFILEGRVIRPPLVDIDTRQQSGENVDREVSFDAVLTDWLRLTIAMNALNRSMGLIDAYPFAVTARVGDKLRFVHEVICAQSQ